MDVYRRLVFSFALTDATGNGWALCDLDAILVAVQCDDEFHILKLASSDWSGQFLEGIVAVDQVVVLVVPTVGFSVCLLRWGLRWTREAASQAWSLAG